MSFVVDGGGDTVDIGFSGISSSATDAVFGAHVAQEGSLGVFTSSAHIY